MKKEHSPASTSGPARLVVAVMVDVGETFFRELVANAAQFGHEAARLLDQLVCPERFTAAGGGAHVPPVVLIPPAGLFPRASTETFAVADPVIARVIEAVRDRACGRLSIAELVEIAGLPRWKLEKQFKAAVGHSIHDDIVRVRLAEASRLIRTTDLPMKEVASRAGFHSVAYLTTIFRLRFGTTPARFRRVEQGGVVQTTKRSR
jgi:LacI family transcriptional regulator